MNSPKNTVHLWLAALLVLCLAAVAVQPQMFGGGNNFSPMLRPSAASPMGSGGVLNLLWQALLLIPALILSKFGIINEATVSGLMRNLFLNGMMTFSRTFGK